MKRDLVWLSDEQFGRISPHLPRDTRGKLRVDDRRVTIRLLKEALSLSVLV